MLCYFMFTQQQTVCGNLYERIYEPYEDIVVNCKSESCYYQSHDTLDQNW